MPWQIEFFRDNDGKDLVAEFLDSLSGKEADKAIRLLEMLEEVGTELEFPSVGHVRGSIYELRTQVAKTNIRFLYARVGKTNFLVLLGIIKNTAKLKERDIVEAEGRLRAWTARKTKGTRKEGTR